MGSTTKRAGFAIAAAILGASLLLTSVATHDPTTILLALAWCAGVWWLLRDGARRMRATGLSWRTTAIGALTPLVGGFAWWAAMSLYLVLRGDRPALPTSLADVVVLYGFALPALVFGGIPVHWLYRHRRTAGLSSYVLAGATVGAAEGFILFRNVWQIVGPVSVGAGGAAAAAFFWYFLVRARGTPNSALHAPVTRVGQC